MAERVLAYPDKVADVEAEFAVRLCSEWSSDHPKRATYTTIHRDHFKRELQFRVGVCWL